MNFRGGLALEEEAFFPDFNSQENFAWETSLLLTSSAKNPLQKIL
jgi:hypothetical protein